MKLSGLVLGSLLAILGMLASLWSLRMLIRAAKCVKAKNFMELCNKTNGKWLAYLLEVSRIVYLTGCIIIYQLMGIIYIYLYILYLQIARDLANETLHEFGVHMLWLERPSIMNLHLIIIALLIMYPLCLMKDLNSLSLFSLFSLITIGYTILVIVIEMPFYFSQYYKKRLIEYWVVNLETADAVSFTVFAFACQPSFFNIYSELRNPKGSRIRKVYIYIYIIFIYR